MRILIIIYLFLIPEFNMYAPNQICIPETNTVEEIPDWLRIKRDCGIPDSEPWSLQTKIKYGKIIEERIKQLNAKTYGIRVH